MKLRTTRHLPDILKQRGPRRAAFSETMKACRRQIRERQTQCPVRPSVTFLLTGRSRCQGMAVTVSSLCQRRVPAARPGADNPSLASSAALSATCSRPPRPSHSLTPAPAWLLPRAARMRRLTALHGLAVTDRSRPSRRRHTSRLVRSQTPRHVYARSQPLPRGADTVRPRLQLSMHDALCSWHSRFLNLRNHR